jgi:hypothetical protein
MKRFFIMSSMVVLSVLLGGSTISTIRAADPPVVQVLATDPTALEGASTGAFTLIRSQGTNADLAVNYTVKGTASNGVDYVLLPGSATIPAGYLAADVLVQPIVDPMNRGNKTVVLNLQTNLTYRLGERRTATVTIVDDIFNNLPPTVALVRPTNGTVFPVPANITLEAEATDADDAVQSVSFYVNDHFLGRDEHAPFSLVWSNAPAGEYTLFARAVDPFGRSTLSSPVHVQVVQTNRPPVVSIVTPANGSVFGLPANIEIRAEASDPDDPVVQVKIFGDEHLLGTFTSGPYSLTWSNVPPGRHVIVARATDAVGLSASAVAQCIVSNAPPVVTIASPANGAVFTQPANIDVRVEASDADDAVVQVKIYGDEHLLGSFTNGPYSLTWSNVPSGRHVIVARATDAVGLSASAVARFTVSNAPPRVSLTAPINGANFPPLANITLAAEATDPDDAVVRVSFWANERLLGVVTNSPYSLVWSNVPPGIYALTARATDPFGLRGYSKPSLISVSGPVN